MDSDFLLIQRMKIGDEQAIDSFVHKYYLYVIAANACKDYHRKKNEIAMEKLPEQLDADTENREEQMDIHFALDSLPHDLREVAILFFLTALFTTGMSIGEIMVQFFLPFNVTCCICFRTLYSKRLGSQVFALLLCMVWIAVWVQIVLNESVYGVISVLTWGFLLLASLPQDFGYYPDFTVFDYLMYIASIKGLRPATAKQRAETLLDQGGLAEVKKKKMKKLSGGMKRRVGIAQAMMNDPKILILDEPTSGLDPNERIRFRNLISELFEDRLILLSTHVVSDIEYIANEILLMKAGQITRSGTSEELIASMSARIWTCAVPRGSIDSYLKSYKVSNVKTVPGGAKLRILSEAQPAENAVLKAATLEDVFLHYFGERAGVDDGQV